MLEIQEMLDPEIQEMTTEMVIEVEIKEEAVVEVEIVIEICIEQTIVIIIVAVPVQAREDGN